MDIEKAPEWKALLASQEAELAVFRASRDVIWDEAGDAEERAFHAAQEAMALALEIRLCARWVKASTAAAEAAQQRALKDLERAILTKLIAGKGRTGRALRAI